jgi:sterol desaturase/sphingolipid hydroxylase (fatty acid hydroxylase superfamily)
LDNVLRGFLSGVPTWTAIQVIVPWAFANFYAPRVSFAELPVWLGFLCLIVPVIHEFHFFCIHRLIHMPMLQKWVHSVHHNSINPSPWSSLSLHPVEHLSCFLTMFHHPILRSNPVIALYQLHVAGFGAVPGHVGFDRIEVTDETLVDSHAYIHYLHHKHFAVNCGDGLIPIAKWLGTFHDGSKAADEQMKARYRGKKARANARKSAGTPAERSADRAGAPGPHIRSQRTAASRGKPGGKTRKTLQKMSAMPWIDACSANDIDAERCAVSTMVAGPSSSSATKRTPTSAPAACARTRTSVWGTGWWSGTPSNARSIPRSSCRWGGSRNRRILPT